MATVEYFAALDLVDEGALETGWRIKQGDYGNSMIRIQILQDGAIVYDADNLPSIVFKRPDGKSVVGTMTASTGNTYVYTLAGSELQYAGMVVLDVKYSATSSRESTLSCRFMVVPDTISSDTTPADVYVAGVTVEEIEEDVQLSKSWAVGGTGVREGEDTNNAKYWSDQAKEKTSTTWGNIGGTLSNQTDLQTALDAKANISEIPTVNDATLTIKQNGTTLGTFTANSSSDVEVDITGGSGGGTWGSITGTLSDQTDLQTALDAKATETEVSALKDDITHFEDDVYNRNIEWNQLGTNKTISATASGGSQKKYISQSTNVTSGHIYLTYAYQTVTLTSNTRNSFFINGDYELYEYGGVNYNLTEGDRYWIFSAPQTGSENFGIWVHTPSSDVTYIDLFACDLTQMFGITSTSDVTDKIKTFCKNYASNYPDYCASKTIKGISDLNEALSNIIGDAWTSGKSYAVGNCAIYNNIVYECILAHTSSSSILPTNTTYWSTTSLNKINSNLSTQIGNLKIRCGTTSATLSQSANLGSATVYYGSSNITYDAFTSTPVIVATVVDGGAGVFGIESQAIEATNCYLTAYGGEKTGITCNIMWIAIGT